MVIVPARVSVPFQTGNHGTIWNISRIRQPNGQYEQIHLTNSDKNQPGSSIGPAPGGAKTKQRPQQDPQIEPGDMDTLAFPIFSTSLLRKPRRIPPRSRQSNGQNRIPLARPAHAKAPCPFRISAGHDSRTPLPAHHVAFPAQLSLARRLTDPAVAGIRQILQHFPAVIALVRYQIKQRRIVRSVSILDASSLTCTSRSVVASLLVSP